MRLEILLKILNLLNDGHNSPCEIYYKTKYSYSTIKEYLKVLVKKGFIKKHGKTRGTRYEITEKGRRFLELWK